MIKQCYVCKGVKPISAFPPSSHGKHGVYGRCIECDARRQRERRKRLQELSPDRSILALREKYRLSLVDYEEMLQAQNGICAICGHTSQKLCIDHDHSILSNGMKYLVHYQKGS